jgi:hypothetical protein
MPGNALISVLAITSNIDGKSGWMSIIFNLCAGRSSKFSAKMPLLSQNQRHETVNDPS